MSHSASDGMGNGLYLLIPPCSSHYRSPSSSTLPLSISHASFFLDILTLCFCGADCQHFLSFSYGAITRLSFLLPGLPTTSLFLPFLNLRLLSTLYLLPPRPGQHHLLGLCTDIYEYPHYNLQKQPRLALLKSHCIPKGKEAKGKNSPLVSVHFLLPHKSVSMNTMFYVFHNINQ